MKREVIWPVVMAEPRPYFCPGCGWNVCRCADGGWRAIQRAREQFLEANGQPVRRVSWTCHHGPHDATSTRGPLVRTHQQYKKSQMFSLRGRVGA